MFPSNCFSLVKQEDYTPRKTQTNFLKPFKNCNTEIWSQWDLDIYSVYTLLIFSKNYYTYITPRKFYRFTLAVRFYSTRL